MKERPTVCSGWEVRAILEGRKTQKRQVVKHPLAQNAKLILGPNKDGYFDCVQRDDNGGGILCQDGQPGDHLWVQETWAAWSSIYDLEADEVDGTAKDLAEMGISRGHISYKADPRMHADRWRPSICMPRWASRITLEIESVRVERLQEISEQDAIAEGAVQWWKESERRPVHGLAKNCYKLLWKSINGPGSWDANPWVWVVKFWRVE